MSTAQNRRALLVKLCQPASQPPSMFYPLPPTHPPALGHSRRVGVGNADYSSMEQLDGDDVRLVDSHGKRASRDIVQFVALRNFAENDLHVLAKEVGDVTLC